VVGALTTVTSEFGRVSIHGLREELLRAQLDACGLPATIVRIPYPCPNEVYERAMAVAMNEAKAAGITHVVFGDLFLQDVRAYREQRLEPIGITPLFPLWHRPTDALAREMIAAGVEARLVCVDLKKLPKHFAGRRFDQALLADLPPGVDPCGENGEFHSFVAAGPMLSRPIAVAPGDTVERDGYAYADVLPIQP
jgi:diphthamide synthase (EF-2-diphthine--ammonia ligase)